MNMKKVILISSIEGNFEEECFKKFKLTEMYNENETYIFVMVSWGHYYVYKIL